MEIFQKESISKIYYGCLSFDIRYEIIIKILNHNERKDIFLHEKHFLKSFLITFYDNI